MAESGASSVLYSALHLRPGAREWYFRWVRMSHPHLIPDYERLYSEGSTAPKEYRRWLAARMESLLRKHGLARGHEDPATGAIRSTALGRMPRIPGVQQPTLF